MEDPVVVGALISRKASGVPVVRRGDGTRARANRPPGEREFADAKRQSLLRCFACRVPRTLTVTREDGEHQHTRTRRVGSPPPLRPLLSLWIDDRIQAGGVICLGDVAAGDLVHVRRERIVLFVPDGEDPGGRTRYASEGSRLLHVAYGAPRRRTAPYRVSRHDPDADDGCGFAGILRVEAA